MAEEKTPERGMVVFAHADDADWGCSGTVALWCKQGMEVVYVVCTDGSKGSDDPDMTSEQLAQTRRDEQLAAGESAGVEGGGLPWLRGCHAPTIPGASQGYNSTDTQVQTGDTHHHQPDAHPGQHGVHRSPRPFRSGERPHCRRCSPRRGTGSHSRSCSKRGWSLTRSGSCW